MTASVQPNLLELLEASGASPAGAHRYNCPDCGGRRTVSANEERGLYHCHHAGCNFHGGIGTLAKRLGIARQWLPRQKYLRKRREREAACEAARRLDHAVHTRRMELFQRLELLRDIERKAYALGPDTETTWDALEMVYLDRPLVQVELEILESASAAEVVGVLLRGASGLELR